MGRIISNIKRFLCEVFVERSMAVQIFWIQCQIAVYIKFCLCVTHNEICKWPWTNFLTQRWRLENLSLNPVWGGTFFFPMFNWATISPIKCPWIHGVKWSWTVFKNLCKTGNKTNASEITLWNWFGAYHTLAI